MRCTEPQFPASYEAAHRYDGAAIQRGRRDELVHCTVQPRDVAIVADVRRYKFLTAPQLRELWWPSRSVQAADRRLLKLFRAGYLDRFRPLLPRGSFPWTYQLGLEGHRLMQRAGLLGPRERFARREVYDYGHVLHDLQLNAWALAYRRAAGQAFLSWEGETTIEAPREAQPKNGRLSLGDGWTVDGLRDERARSLKPDAVLEVVRNDREDSCLLFIEYDRTKRVDKNFEKFRRYDTFLCWWIRHSSYRDRELPYVLFVCQDEDQRNQFLHAADRELTGRHSPYYSATASQKAYVGRNRILFTRELDAHSGHLQAHRLPEQPPERGGPQRADATVRRVRLPGHRSQLEEAAQVEFAAQLP